MASLKFLETFLALVLLINLVSPSTATNLDAGSDFARLKRGADGIAASILVDIPADVEAQVLEYLPSTVLSNLLANLTTPEETALLANLPPALLAQVLAYLPTDVLANLLVNLSPSAQANLLSLLPPTLLNTILSDLPANLSSIITANLPANLTALNGLPLDCQTVSFVILPTTATYPPNTTANASIGTVNVMPLVGQIVCPLNPVLTQICTDKTLPKSGLAEILVAVLTLVMYVLYRLCLDNLGFAALGMLGLNLYYDQCLLYTAPYLPALGGVNFTNLQDIVEILLIGVYKLLIYVVKATIPVAGLGLLVLALLEVVSSLKLDLTVQGLLIGVINLVNGLNILPFIPDTYAIDPTAKFDLSYYPSLDFLLGFAGLDNLCKNNLLCLFIPDLDNTVIQGFLYKLGLVLTTYLKDILDGLLCDVTYRCTLQGGITQLVAVVLLTDPTCPGTEGLGSSGVTLGVHGTSFLKTLLGSLGLGYPGATGSVGVSVDVSASV
jgi:hypothetical protein